MISSLGALYQMQYVIQVCDENRTRGAFQVCFCSVPLAVITLENALLVDAVESVHFISNEHEDDRESGALGGYNQAVCLKLHRERCSQMNTALKRSSLIVS